MDTFLKMKNQNNIKPYTRDCVWYLQGKQSLELQWVGQGEKEDKRRTASVWPWESYSSNNLPLTAGFASWSSGWSPWRPWMRWPSEQTVTCLQVTSPGRCQGGPSLGISWLPKVFYPHRGTSFSTGPTRVQFKQYINKPFKKPTIY